MRGLSISLRLAIWYAAISALGFAIFGVVMWFVLANSMISWKDRTLQMRANRVAAVLAHLPAGASDDLNAKLDEAVGDLPEGELIQVLGVDGERLFPRRRSLPSPELPASRCPVEFVRDLLVDKERFRQLCQPAALAGGIVYVVAPSSLQEDRILLRNFTQGLYRTIPFILLASGLCGYLLSRRALRPIDVLIAEARAMTTNDLSRRLTVPAPDDQLRRLALEWNALLARMDAAMVRIMQFTADASHELRNPIALIRATAEYSLGNASVDQDSRDSFQLIVDETKAASSLLEDLLTLARVDSPSPLAELEPVDIHATSQEVANLLRPLVRGKRQTLIVNTVAMARRSIPMNRIHLRRVLIALLENAIKYTPEGGSITVTGDLHAGCVLRIADTGVGIAPQHIERIFDRFFRVDKVRTDMSDGVGLGLAIAKSLTELYGGTISVESRVDQGTTFTVIFPDAKPVLQRQLGASASAIRPM